MRERPAGTINPNLPSGEVEVLATKLTVLAKSKTPPFHHDEPVSEELRLQLPLPRSAPRADAEATCVCATP